VKHWYPTNVMVFMKEGKCLTNTVLKWKNETCSNYSGNGKRGIKKNDGGGEFNCDILYKLL
jgi:hypothetical protein